MLALFTEEQEMLREMAAKLAESVGLTNPDDLETVDRAAGWRNLADSGLLALRTREGGAPAASGVEVMLVAEALGGALAPLPFVGTAAALELLALVGAPDAWLDEASAGTTRYGLLLGPDLSALADVDQLDGVVAWDVDEAEWALALRGSGDDRRVVRVALGDGWSPLAAADLTREVKAAGGAPQIIEEAGALGAGVHERWLAMALVLVSADAAGVMRSGLSRAVEYAKERVQYGVKIGSFQAIQHLCAETLVKVEASASAVRYAAWAIDELPPDEALLAARTAKAHVAGVSRDVTETVMQVFGGIGQTWEHIAHVYTRRALMDRQVLGDGPTQLDAIADARLQG